MILPAVPTVVMKILLKRYLVKGTVPSDITLNIFLKFSKVGLLGINLGGNTHNSSAPLKELDIIKANGNAITTANVIKTIRRKNVPIPERLTLLFTLKICNFAITSYQPSAAISE